MTTDANKQALIAKLRDPKFYLENFCKIKGKQQGKLVPFILNEAQKDLFNTVKKNSRVILLKARQLGMCLDPDTKVLTADLRWVRIDDVQTGEAMVAVDEMIPGGRGAGRKMRTAVVENKFEVFEEAFRLTLDNGQEIIATGEHRFLSLKNGCTDTVWRKVKDFKLGDPMRRITSVWGDGDLDDAWYGGMMDGEGSLRFVNHGGAEACVAQRTHGVVWEEMCKYVQDKKFFYAIELDNRPATPGGKFSGKECGKVVMNRMDELFRLIGLTRPRRFVGVRWWEGKDLPGKRSGVAWLRVIKIEALGKRRMVDLQTSLKTYIAEGVVSHNSTAMVGYFYHNTIMNPGTNTALIGYNSELTAELLDKVKTFYRSTPAGMRPTIHYNSKYEISFPKIDSKILVLPSTMNVGRGYTLHNCLSTELSSWAEAEEKMITLEASVPINGKLVIESTPRGMGNYYHRTWMSDNDYAKKEYGWWWGYSKEEVETVRRRMNNPLKFAQEYELAFLSSGRMVFDLETIKSQEKNIKKVGEQIDDGEGKVHTVHVEDDLRIYKEPQAGHYYVCGADVSEGVFGGDYSSAIIWDRTTGEEVAMYRGLMPADQFGAKLDRWGRKYLNALMAVEVNNHGLTTITILRQLLYPALYFRPAKFETPGMAISSKIGWRTTKVTRPLMIDELAQALREGVMTVHSKELLDEMMVFAYDDNGNMNAQEGFHDDVIFAAAIGFQGFKLTTAVQPTQLDYEDFLPKSFSY